MKVRAIQSEHEGSAERKTGFEPCRSQPRSGRILRVRDGVTTTTHSELALIAPTLLTTNGMR